MYISPICKLFLRQYLEFGLMWTYIIFQYVRYIYPYPVAKFEKTSTEA